MRRPRSFWEARIAELAHGQSVERVARQHGVPVARLRWWRWRLGTPDASVHAAPRMIELLPAPPRPPAPLAATIRIVVGDLVVELPAQTSPEFLGRVLGAARAAC